MLQILMRLRLVEEKDLYAKGMHYKDVNDLDELRDEVTDDIQKIFA